MQGDEATGKIQKSWARRLFQTECAGDRLHKFGRLERVLFTVDWISDLALRWRANARLDQGKVWNALARVVFLHNLGEICDRAFENQWYWASGLKLAISL